MATANGGAERREEFRKYLERTRVTTVLTSALTDLFEMENRPEDPLAFMHQRLGEAAADAGKAGKSASGPEKGDAPAASTAPSNSA